MLCLRLGTMLQRIIPKSSSLLVRQQVRVGFTLLSWTMGGPVGLAPVRPSAATTLLSPSILPLFEDTPTATPSNRDALPPKTLGAGSKYGGRPPRWPPAAMPPGVPMLGLRPLHPRHP